MIGDAALHIIAWLRVRCAMLWVSQTRAATLDSNTNLGHRHVDRIVWCSHEMIDLNTVQGLSCFQQLGLSSFCAVACHITHHNSRIGHGCQWHQAVRTCDTVACCCCACRTTELIDIGHKPPPVTATPKAHKWHSRQHNQSTADVPLPTNNPWPCCTCNLPGNSTAWPQSTNSSTSSGASQNAYI